MISASHCMHTLNLADIPLKISRSMIHESQEHGYTVCLTPEPKLVKVKDIYNRGVAQ
jgi:hypothetical protein